MSQNRSSQPGPFNPSRYVSYPSMLRRRGSVAVEQNQPRPIVYPQLPLSKTSWKTWNQVIASFYVCFCTMGLGNSFGVFQSYYEDNLLDSYSPSTISWIGTTQGFLLSIIAFLSGYLYDRGYVRYLFYVGSVLNVIGLLGTSFATSYATIFLAFGVALGLGCGMMYVPAIALISSHFEKNKAPLPTAIAMSGSSIGGIIYPILFRQLVQKVGFYWACRVFASINGGLLLIACLLVRPKKKEEENSVMPPWRTLLDWKLAVFSTCALLMNVGVDVPFYFIPTFVRDQLKQSPEVGDSLLAGLNASSLLGRLFLNRLSESASALIIWQFTILITSALLFWWYTIDNMAGAIQFVVCYGFVDGGLISLIAPCLQELYSNGRADRIDSTDPAFGARLGVAEGFQGVGFLIGPPIAGAILASPAGYFGVSLFNGVLYFVLFLLVGAFFTRKYFMKEKSEEENNTGDETLLQPLQPNQEEAPREEAPQGEVHQGEAAQVEETQGEEARGGEVPQEEPQNEDEIRRRKSI
ncbi:MFS general substrate transporter [Hypoxylon cercidicola]|nr:MFS general substrate transporter [Hypoxylon cercidicola]